MAWLILKLWSPVFFCFFLTGSVFKAGWRDCPAEWYQPSLEKDFSALRTLRNIVNRALNEARSQKQIHSFLEASVTITTDSAELQSVISSTFAESTVPSTNELPSLSNFLLVSQAQLSSTTETGTEKSTDSNSILTSSKYKDSNVQVSVNMSPFHKCPRCWKHTSDKQDHLCTRCQFVLNQI